MRAVATANMALSERALSAFRLYRTSSSATDRRRAKANVLKRLALSEREHLVKRECGDGTTLAKCHVGWDRAHLSTFALAKVVKSA